MKEAEKMKSLNVPRGTKKSPPIRKAFSIYLNVPYHLFNFLFFSITNLR